jgi:hypothetical protein
MNAQSPVALFQNARRRRPFAIVAGVLLVFGYIGAGAVLIHDYTVQTATIGGPRA